MCTAITYQTKDTYFGRTLDYDFSYGEDIVIMPRNFLFPFHNQDFINKKKLCYHWYGTSCRKCNIIS